MLHPISAHFAIVFPIVSLVLGLMYIYRQNITMAKLTTGFMFFSTLFLVAGFLTGKEDGSEVYVLLSEEGQKLLIQHKDLGFYLTLGMAAITSMNILGFFKRNFKLEFLSVVLLGGLAIGVFYQGKMGGDLTYTYGAHVKDHSDGMDCLDDPSDFLEEEEE